MTSGPARGELTRRDALRACTQAAHHRLDHHPVLAGLVRKPFNAQAVWHALAALAGTQQVLEALPGGWVQRNWLRPRWPALAADLRALSTRVWTDDDPALLRLAELSPPAVPWPLIPSRLDAAGYVLWGSQMGGRFIHHQLTRHAPPTWEPLAFFAQALAPEATAPAAIQWLTAPAATDPLWTVTEQAARDWFDWLHAHLDHVWELMD